MSPANIIPDTSPNPSRHDSPSIPPNLHPTADLTSTQGHLPDQDVSASRPTKRQRTSRRHANMAAERASPSSDDSSQSGMADNETEAERSQLSERSAQQASSPQKKKRTRTLTTPHQSAVLHALLAKSRFPTTAMREDVGRQIGLSARKVQIWFQNQRQKARRPQAESGPLTRPPQFGPFPIITAGPSSYPSPSAGGPPSEVSPSCPSSARSADSLDLNPPLSGPGMPGWSSHQRRHSSAEVRDPPRQALKSPQFLLANSQHPLLPRSSDVISTRDSRGGTRGLAPRPPAQATHVQSPPNFSRVLPPINLSALEPRSSTESCVSATASFPPQPTSRTIMNTVQRHDGSAVEPGSSPVFPPPFALQPQPQWDPHTFAPFTRPEFASWSYPSGSARLTLSAVGVPDRVPHNLSPRGRHFYSFSDEPRRSGQPDPPLLHHIIPASRAQRHSTSASSSLRASGSGHGHVRSDDHVGEA
ncbi:homeobox-domain-containing protein [Imleria badia]|nr:homeobox-domain-containing protein [Imleria badia]